MRTVKEVSSLSGISVRTLHYYDEIGLLKPSFVTESKYRLYDDKALERLQQILFFKEFDLPLKQILSIMNHPNFDKDKILSDQRKILQIKRDRLDGLINLIDTILKGDHTMSFQEFSKEDIEMMFQSLLANMDQKQLAVIEKEYGDLDHFKESFLSNAGSEQAQRNFQKVTEWYGSKEAAMNAAQNPVSAEILQSYQNRISEIFTKLSSLQHVDPNEFEIKRLIGEYEFVSKQLYQMSDVKLMLLELAKEYTENADLIRANDEQYGTGSSRFIAQAIRQYYGQPYQLKQE